MPGKRRSSDIPRSYRQEDAVTACKVTLWKEFGKICYAASCLDSNEAVVMSQLMRATSNEMDPSAGTFKEKKEATIYCCMCH